MIFLPSKGWFNVVKRYATQPNPQMSALKSYFSYLIIYGDKYKGVPTLLYNPKSVLIIFETPKSPIYTR